MPIFQKQTLIVLTLACLVLSDSWSTQAQATPSMGGQDVLIDHPGFTRYSDLLDVTVANDGTLFAACHGDPGLDIMNIYRSADGGSTWNLWDQIVSEYPVGRVHQAELLTNLGNPGNLYVAWVDQRLDNPFSQLRFSYAGVSEETPNWTTVTVSSASGFEMHDPRLDITTFSAFLSRMGMAWRHGDTLRFSTSYSAAVNWSSPVVVGTAPSGATIADLDLCLDSPEEVYLTWATTDPTSNINSIYFNRADGGGSHESEWDGETSIYAVADQELISVTIAADPGSPDDVVIAAGGMDGSTTPLRILSSASNGYSWDPAVLVPFHSHPDLAWSENGPVMLTDTWNPDELGSSWAVSTLEGESWTAEALVQHEGAGSTRTGAALVLDPTHDDQPVVVGLRTLLGDIDVFGLWFNAGWRDQPGYGVPDPHNAHSTAGQAITRPVLPGDLNGDGTLELVFTEQPLTGNDILKVYNPDNDDIVFEEDNVHPESEFALVDINGDGDLEVFWVNDDHQLEGRQGGGNTLAGFPVDLSLGTTGPYWISGAHVTGNPGQDVVVAANSSVHVVGQGGIERPGWPWNAHPDSGVNYGRAALGDVDDDGSCDLVVPMTGRMVILDREGQVTTYFGEGEAAPGSPSLADFDGDGDLEIAIPRLNGSVHLVHHDGTTVTASWPYQTVNGGMPSQVALANIAGDERRDLVFMDAGHVVHAVTPAGAVVIQREADVEASSPEIEPIVAMIGSEEVTLAVGAEDGIMRVIGLDGRQEGWPRDMGEPILTASAVADVDADGMLEMIVPTTESLWVLDMGVAVPDSLDLWTMSGFDPGRSGCAEPQEGAVSAVESSVPTQAALHGAAPNPFNPRTTISFSLGVDVPQASLRVYDVAGRLVRTLVQGTLLAGDHSVVWQGTNESDRAMASGVYFYRLETGKQIETKSMVLVR